MKRLLGWTLAVALLSLNAVAEEDWPEIERYEFFSRPDLKAPKLNVSVNNNPAPGYIFLTPYAFTGQENVEFQYGPYIYDNDGELVWSGASVHPDVSLGAFDLHVCDYKQSPHLCYTHPDRNKGVVTRHDILDDSYTKVMEVANVGPVDGAEVEDDTHEFHLVHPSRSAVEVSNVDGKRVIYRNDKTALVTSLVIVPHNATLPHCDGQPQVSWIKSHLFQELTLDGTNTVLFEWSAIDHVPVHETNQCPDEEPFITGNGIDKASPLDYFHLNAIDKDEDDNYIISARHTSTLYKLNGTTGEVIWRLGGRRSDMELLSEVQNEPLALAYQHHVRFDNLMAGADGVSKFGLTLWNNQNSLQDRGNKKADYSSGYSILVDENTMQATLKDIWISPDRQLDANQGSHQVLPNRNHLIGLGDVPWMAEYNDAHQLVFYANLGATRVNSYRYLRYPWVGRPKDSPTLFAYAPSCHGRVKFHVSWNGATEVKYWSFFVGRSPEQSKMRRVASSTRNGFETKAQGGSGTYAYAIAYDEYREQIGETEVVEVFIPSYEIFDYCTEMNCGYGFDYDTAPRKRCTTLTFPSENTPITISEPNIRKKNGTLKKAPDSPIQIQMR